MQRQVLAVAVMMSMAAVTLAQPPGNPGVGAGQPPAGDPSQLVPPPNPMFDVIDADGDGVITIRELRRAVAALKTLDIDQDGQITREEASGPGSLGGPAGPGAPVNNLGQAVDRWMTYDQNGDGKLTVEELPPQMVQMLAGADQNNDRGIDRAELTFAMQNAPNRFGMGPANVGLGPIGVGVPGRNAPQFNQELLQYDRNGDGKLSPDEVPPQLRRMLNGGDQNRDGVLDAEELKQLSERMEDRNGGRGRRLGRERLQNERDARGVDDAS